MPRICVIATVYNEEDSISRLLDSLLAQTRLPDEIIVADGGSTDRTPDIIGEYAARNARIRLVTKPGSISVGRNAAIQAANADIIACTDAGCEADSKWLEEISQPLLEDSSVDVASGFYEPRPLTVFEECAGVVSLLSLHEVNPETFLPSARSVAFRRSAWKLVGGFPLGYQWGEDTVFDVLLRRAGCRFVFTPKAVVRWRPRGSLGEVYLQHKRYAYGDGKALMFFRSYFKVTAAYLLGVALLAAGWWHLWAFAGLGSGAAAYTAKLCLRARKRGVSVTFRHAANLLAAGVARDIGSMVGIVSGTAARFRAAIAGCS